MRIRAVLQVITGAVVALVVPVTFRIYAQLLEEGVVTLVRDGSTMSVFTTIALTEVILGPLGIAIAGKGAGLRRASAWIVLVVVAVPVLALVWFVCIATLSGAIGSPL